MISKYLDRIIDKDSDVFILDFSWHLHRNWNSYKWMTAGYSGVGRPTGHIYGILNTIQSIKNVYPEAKIFMCKDGVPVERLKMYQEQGTSYKEGRPELEYDFYQDIDSIMAMAYLVPGVYFAYDEYKESDDIMYALAKQCETLTEKPIYIYSGDDDLLQSISDRIFVTRVMKEKEFQIIDNYYLQHDVTMLKKYNGVDSYHLPYYRCIIGDKSDKMPGIPRFPRKFASQLAMECSKFEDLFDYGAHFIPSGTLANYFMMINNDYRSTIELNYKMMKLSSDINVPLSRKLVNGKAVNGLIDSFKLFKFKTFANQFKGDIK